MSGAGTSHGKARRRDRLLGRFVHSRSSSPAASASQPATTKPNDQSLSRSTSQVSSSIVQPSNVPFPGLTVQPSASSSSTTDDFLAAALQHLSPRELQILQPCISSSNDDINDVLKQSVARVKEKQAECETKRWTFTVAGRSTALREEADKVIHWLNRFKSVGDVAVSADPVHAGLAWAGVRLLLEVLVSEANVMASLLIRCKTVLYMINRLDAYLAFWHSLPDSLPPRIHLKDVMAEMYGCVLGFLAQAIETYQSSGIKHAINSLWQESDVQDFESRCKDLADRVEKQADACDRVLSEKDRTTTMQSYQDLQQVLQELQQIRSVQVVVDRIERKIDLQGPKIVREALFDAHAQKHTACHPSTREALLQQIRDWAKGADSKGIFWLQGMAGTGKSTISWTIADSLSSHAPKDQVDLGATFFFERRENDRASAQFLFPTIIHQLAQRIPGLDVLVAEAVRKNPDITSKNPAEKFKVLIRQPLQQLAPISGQPVRVIVIDALDECKIDEIVQVQRLLSELTTFTNVQLRLFLTSRPEVPIQQTFKGLSPDVLHVVLLEEVPRPVIQQDILTYLRTAFIAIRTNYNNLPLLDEELPEDWPGEDILRDLTDMAIPLFIVAATIHRFVHDVGPLQPDPRERLDVVLQSRKLGHLSSLMQIYLPVLGYLTPLSSGEADPADGEKLCGEFRMIVGSIVTLAEPLSRKALAQLLNLPDKVIALHLRPLYSVLQIPSAVDAPVRILHLSFAEFLTSSRISNRPFAINSKATHEMLFEQCIHVLSRPDLQGLRENICHLEFPGKPRHDVSSAQANEHLSAEVQYACRYWVYHAEQSQHKIRDNGLVHTFLRQHFLHWLEALSLMRCLAIVIKQIGTLQLLVTYEESTHTKGLLEDARRFVLANRHVCEQAPLQLYSSSLIFAPLESIVREECGKMPSWIQRTPNTFPKEWGPEIQVLEGHTGSVLAVTFSPDGAFLASASSDDSVRLWDVSTGQEVQKLEGHTDKVSAAVFASSDGLTLASASWDRTVRLWDVRSGDQVQKLEKPGRLEALICSPNKLLLAFSFDTKILVWRIATGQEEHELEGHSNDVWSLAFSADGTLLASGSMDRTVRLWSVNTGQCIHKLEGHESAFSSVAFSSNNVLASGSYTTIRLWSATTGQELKKIKTDTGGLSSVAFSSLNPHTLLTVHGDSTIRVWNTITCEEMQRLPGHTLGVNAASLSPDEIMIASASRDNTVRLWNVSSDTRDCQSSESDLGIARLMFSPDAALLAAGHNDGIVRLFDVISGDEIKALEGHTNCVTCLAFSPDGALLATASHEPAGLLWNVSNGQLVRKLEGHTQGGDNVRFLQGGTSLVSTMWDGTILIWDTTTGQEIWKSEGNPNTSHSEISLAFSPDETLLTSSMKDKIWLWDITTGQEILKLQGLTHHTSALAVSSDRSLLASGAQSGEIYLWDVSTGQKISTLEGHTEDVNVLTFDPDNHLLASASWDRTIRMWNVSTGQEVRIIELKVAVDELKFAPDRSYMITPYGYVRTGLTDNGSAGRPLSRHGVDGELYVNGDWIQHCGQNILWLPSDYRQYRTMAVHGNLVAIGRKDGRLCILKIDYP